MHLPHPKTSKEFPKFIFMYWIILWGTTFLFFVLKMMFNVTSDGKFVEKRECIREQEIGRLGENTACVEYDDPEYVPVGLELKSGLFASGVTMGVICSALGFYLMFEKKKEERKAKAEAEFEENIRKALSKISNSKKN